MAKKVMSIFFLIFLLNFSMGVFADITPPYPDRDSSPGCATVSAPYDSPLSFVFSMFLGLGFALWLKNRQK